MSYKTVLVHISTPDRSGAALAAAIALARTHGAHLTGLHASETLDSVALALAAPYGEVGLPDEVIERDREEAEKAEEAAGAFFAEKTRGTDLITEWRIERGSYADVVALHARYADIAVIGESSRDAEDAAVDRFLPEDVVLSVGRPVLVVPANADAADIGHKVLVAWNAGREATRAVTDALPLLEHADSVTVLAVNPRPGPLGHGDVPSSAVSLYLARHGVKAEAAEARAEDEEVGEIIMKRAREIGADVIVAGAYGHSRLREYVLGGVTRTLLRRSEIPVLMSH